MLYNYDNYFRFIVGNEAGTIDCYVFLESKEQIAKILFNLNKIDNTEHICDQLKSIYQQIDGMHELKKIKRKKLSRLCS